MTTNYPSNGKSWTTQEEESLLHLFDANEPIDVIANAHGRTPNAIVGRLVRLNRLAQAGRAYYRLHSEPFATFEQLAEGRNNSVKQEKQ